MPRYQNIYQYAGSKGVFDWYRISFCCTEGSLSFWGALLRRWGWRLRMIESGLKWSAVTARSFPQIRYLRCRKAPSRASKRFSLEMKLPIRFFFFLWSRKYQLLFAWRVKTIVPRWQVLKWVKKISHLIVNVFVLFGKHVIKIRF